MDTTGNPRAIEIARSRLSDLGTLVLAGESGSRKLTYNFYPEVHLRGLGTVGVVPLLVGAGDQVELRSHEVEAPPYRARPGAKLPARGWYRLSALPLGRLPAVPGFVNAATLIAFRTSDARISSRYPRACSFLLGSLGEVRPS